MPDVEAWNELHGWRRKEACERARALVPGRGGEHKRRGVRSSFFWVSTMQNLPFLIPKDNNSVKPTRPPGREKKKTFSSVSPFHLALTES